MRSNGRWKFVVALRTLPLDIDAPRARRLSMNIAPTTRPLPELGGLETRILLGPDAPFQPTRFVDLVQVSQRDTFGRKDSFASIDDALRAARELSATQATPVAVVSGFMDFNFGSDPRDKPSYFLSQLKVARTG